jgi:hypothetical protein
MPCLRLLPRFWAAAFEIGDGPLAKTDRLNALVTGELLYVCATLSLVQCATCLTTEYRSQVSAIP